MKMFWSFMFVVFLQLQYSCSTEPENKYTYFKIMVDSLSHRDTISVNDTLKIKFYGIVGPDGCHKFSHFEAHKKTNEVELTVWGSKPDYPTACPEILVYLDGEEYNTVFSQAGLYYIKINQPDNSILLDSVYVQ